MKIKRIVGIVVCVAILMFALTGCVPGDARYTVDTPAGFWWGIWHGFIIIISFIISVFTGGSYTIYESINTGWPYNLGFLLGVGMSIGGSSGGLININIKR